MRRISKILAYVLLFIEEEPTDLLTERFRHKVRHDYDLSVHVLTNSGGVGFLRVDRPVGDQPHSSSPYQTLNK